MPLKRFETVADMATTPSLIGRERRYRLLIPDAMDAEEREAVKHAALWLACMNLLGKKDVEIRFSDTKPKDGSRLQVVLTRELCHKNLIEARVEAKQKVMDLVMGGKAAGDGAGASEAKASVSKGKNRPARPASLPRRFGMPTTAGRVGISSFATVRRPITPYGIRRCRRARPWSRRGATPGICRGAQWTRPLPQGSNKWNGFLGGCFIPGSGGRFPSASTG